jgi:hypothetical protein
VSGLSGRNLRTRLTVFYAALLATAFVAYAVCISAFFLHNLREQLDASLDAMWKPSRETSLLIRQESLN